ncbi:MAG: DNA repair protein RecN [Bacillota bacterium]|nr:DNA repair protein RecN [Bacillota bacterium]
MIKHISIKNFAIIENVQVDFHDGLNIITGETGAGKSIVIEAISLALGSRADTTFVRSGQDKALVQMVADLDGQEYIITREVSASGRNTCRINDEIVTLGTLSSLCKKIADIHGQYDHQSLLDPENHIQLVDLYHKEEIDPAKADVKMLYDEYTSLRSELAALKARLAESKRQRDFMEFELKEIRSADLSIGEDEDLAERIALLQNSERIFENLAGAYDISSENEYSLLSGMKQVSDMLMETEGFSSQLKDLSDRVSNLYYEFQDACSEIRACRDSTVFSAEELDEAISRLELLEHLKSKHGRSIQGLLDYAEELENSLDSIDNADERTGELEAEIKKMRIALTGACNKLSDARKRAAAQLQELISDQLAQLNFHNAEFMIDFRSTMEGEAKETGFTPEGTDIVEFLIKTNVGEPLKPLSKIASGGEMSRIMLAFKKIIGDYDQIPTMIFDEIDSGISGIAASVVGRKLKEIAEKHQIICITHLPQIAAYGTHNYMISKQSDDSMTYTSVKPLNEEEKALEIARLLGGDNVTKTTLASARELIGASS